MRRASFGAALVAAAALTAAPVMGANILTNPGFESPVVAAQGNNIGTVPPGWAADTGNSNAFNLVGATGAGQGGSNQFLDLTNGGTYISQTFTLGSQSSVDFGGWFSPRDGGTGGGATQIYNAANATLLASSPR